jgi:hypothetical protein
MGFIKRDEFDELKAALEELKQSQTPKTAQSVKKSAVTTKKKPASKKTTTQKKSAR